MGIAQATCIKHAAEVHGMSNIVEGRATLCLDIGRISGFGKSEEILSRGNGMGPGVAAIDGEVMRHPLGKAYQHSVVLRGARILVRANGSEAVVRPGAQRQRRILWRLDLEIEEASMRGIRRDHGSIDIALTKETRAKLSDVLDFSDHVFAELSLDSGIE